MVDDNWLEEEGRYNYKPPSPQTPLPGQAVPVQQTASDSAPNPQTRETDPWYWDYNNGSPPAVALGGGMQGWKWDQTRWWQTPEPGIQGVATPQARPAPRPGGGGDGGVPPVQANIPPATLPGPVQATFDKPAQKTPIQSAFQDALLKYLGKSQEAPSLDDPYLRPQSELFRVQQQRDQEKNRRFAAERAAATGRSQSGYLDNLINQGVQQQRLNTQQFNSNLLGGELSKRREELQTALQIAQAAGDNEAARELQARLAQVSAQMQQQGLNLQGQLGFGDLALRALLAQMGNDQFYDQLGINTSLGLENLNQNALWNILNRTGG